MSFQDKPAYHNMPNSCFSAVEQCNSSSHEHTHKKQDKKRLLFSLLSVLLIEMFQSRVQMYTAQCNIQICVCLFVLGLQQMIKFIMD